MEQYMKATATPFVHHALKDTILKIMESKQSCEVEAYNGFSSLTHTDANSNLFPHPILFFPVSIAVFESPYLCLFQAEPLKTGKE